MFYVAKKNPVGKLGLLQKTLSVDAGRSKFFQNTVSLTFDV
jgi:hypothetical protein